MGDCSWGFCFSCLATSFNDFEELITGLYLDEMGIVISCSNERFHLNNNAFLVLVHVRDIG